MSSGFWWILLYVRRHVTRVADAKEDALEALYEKRLKKKALQKEKEESGVQIDPVDALPVKTLDGKLYYRTCMLWLLLAFFTCVCVRTHANEWSSKNHILPLFNGVEDEVWRFETHFVYLYCGVLSVCKKDL